jgi:hypothetical protein
MWLLYLLFLNRLNGLLGSPPRVATASCLREPAHQKDRGLVDVGRRRDRVALAVSRERTYPGRGGRVGDVECVGRARSHWPPTAGGAAAGARGGDRWWSRRSIVSPLFVHLREQVERKKLSFFRCGSGSTEPPPPALAIHDPRTPAFAPREDHGVGARDVDVAVSGARHPPGPLQPALAPLEFGFPPVRTDVVLLHVLGAEHPTSRVSG